MCVCVRETPGIGDCASRHRKEGKTVRWKVEGRVKRQGEKPLHPPSSSRRHRSSGSRAQTADFKIRPSRAERWSLSIHAETIGVLCSPSAQVHQHQKRKKPNYLHTPVVNAQARRRSSGKPRERWRLGALLGISRGKVT